MKISKDLRIYVYFLLCLFFKESIPSHQGRFDNIPKPWVKCIFLLTQKYCENTEVLVVGEVCLKLTIQG